MSGRISPFLYFFFPVSEGSQFFDDRPYNRVSRQDPLEKADMHFVRGERVGATKLMR